MKKGIVIIIGCLILCMSMGGCAYLAAERNGAMFPSTASALGIWRNVAAAKPIVRSRKRQLKPTI